MAKGKYYKKPEKKEDFNKKVRKVIHQHEKETVELKQFVVGETSDIPVYAAASFTAGGPGYYLGCITEVAQGFTGQDRIGDQLILKKIKVRARVHHFPGANTNVFNTFRIVIFQFKASNSAVVPSADDMFVSAAIGGAGIHSAFDHRNNDYTTVYNVLYDRVFTSSNNHSAVAGPAPDTISKWVNIDLPMKYVHKKLKFENTSLNSDYPIYVACTTDGTVNATANPTFIYSASVWYTDA